MPNDRANTGVLKAAPGERHGSTRQAPPESRPESRPEPWPESQQAHEPVMGQETETTATRFRKVVLPRLLYEIGKLWFSGLFYPRTLAGRRPRHLDFTPTDLWPGDSTRGADIMRGEYRFAGVTVRQAAPNWRPEGATEAWECALHGFGWLRDLHAVGGDAPRAEARRLILDWIARESRWRPVSWRPDILGERVANWLIQARFLASGADGEFSLRYLESLGRQMRHLRRVARLARVGPEKLVALKGLIYAALAIPEERRRLDKWLRLLAAEIDAQILGDGGHVDRSPAVQLAVLRDLVEIRAALRDAGAETPDALQNAIDRMTPMMRFFRHGDGGLALFNDTNEGEDWLVDVVLTKAEARGKPLLSAPHSGFQRVAANRATVIMDTGTPVRGAGRHAHAGTLSFEMSIGKERMIVNCGANAGGNDHWRTAQRATAAHSTVTVDDLNSSEIGRDGIAGRGPEEILVERHEEDGNTWIEAEHDGYLRALGLIHRRRLFVADGGGSLRGEDTLEGPGHHRFVARFHLHPSVRASLVQDGESVLLRLPSGMGWRFRAKGGVTGLRESVYLGIDGEMKRCEQIVVSGATQDRGARLKWAFARLAR